jgi:uncharacterized cofD-like protein
MVIPQKINITTLGWGTGTFNVLSGLKFNENYNLAAIVSMSDSGGSTGVLRDEFGILPPGDIRRALLALSQESEIFRQLFSYRFARDTSVNGHTIWNLLLTAMTDIMGSFEAGLDEISEIMKIQGKVIPVTLEKSDLVVELENGQCIFWESNIDVPEFDTDLRIQNAYLEPRVVANSRAIEMIENSDIIIIGPGDLYTSLIPNLLVEGISEAICRSGAKVVYFCNIMTKRGETTHFDFKDFIEVVEKYLWKDRLDYVVVNNGHISDEMVEKYKEEEGKKPVKIKESDDFSDVRYKVIERDLLNEQDYVRHNPEKIAGVIDEIVEGWVK